MKPVLIMYPRKLAKHLRGVAAAWDEHKERSRHCNEQFSCGICKAVEKQWPLNEDSLYDAYGNINKLLGLVQDRWAEDGRIWLERSGKDFNKRATMCLFMAEWLETDYIAQS